MRMGVGSTSSGMQKDKNNRGGGKSLTTEQNAHVRKLIETRLLGKWTQLALAEQLRMDQSSLSKFMAGKQGTTFQTVMIVAELLGESPLELLGLESDGARDVLPARAAARKAARLLGHDPVDIDAGLKAEMSQDTAERNPRDWIRRVERARAVRLGEVPPRTGADNPPDGQLPPPPPAGALRRRK